MLPAKFWIYWGSSAFFRLFNEPLPGLNSDFPVKYEDQNKNQMRRKIYYIFAFCLILTLAIFVNRDNQFDNPPKFYLGATNKGQIIKSGLLKFDENEKLISENLNRNDQVLTKKGIHF